MTYTQRRWLTIAGCALGVAVLIYLAVFYWPNRKDKTTSISAGQSTPAIRFVDVTEQAGIHFRHNSGASGRKLLPETMGAGVAVIDFDGDGLPDLFFVNSRAWPGQSSLTG